MSHRIKVKEKDTKPPVEATLRQGNGEPVPLDEVDEIRFQVEDSMNTKIVDGEAEVVNKEGRVRYEWQDGDTDEHGKYKAEFDITFSDGSVLTVPNNTFIPVLIRERIE